MAMLRDAPYWEGFQEARPRIGPFLFQPTMRVKWEDFMFAFSFAIFWSVLAAIAAAKVIQIVLRLVDVYV